MQLQRIVFDIFVVRTFCCSRFYYLSWLIFDGGECAPHVHQRAMVTVIAAPHVLETCKLPPLSSCMHAGHFVNHITIPGSYRAWK